MSRARQGPLSEIDLLVATLLGFEEREPLPALAAGQDLRTVTEELLLEALRRGRVGVALLGGTPSAYLLAVAQATARAHGLEEPIPLSLSLNRPQMRNDEEFQAYVVRHLGLGDRWERLAVGDELELLGPHARAVIDRLGILYPANVYWARPLAERLAGGTLVVSHAGEELDDYWPYRPMWEMLRGKRRPSIHALRLAALALTPRPGRTRVLRRRFPPPDLAWLTPTGRAALAAQWSNPGPPVRWSAALPQMRRQRCHRAVPESYASVAAEFSVEVLFPWQTGVVASAILADSDLTGWKPLSEAWTHYFGDLLPAHIAMRKDRAAYGGVFFGAQTRAFGRSWSGGGLNRELVKVDALRELWTSERYDWRSSALMQTAWRHDQDAAGGR